MTKFRFWLIPLCAAAVLIAAGLLLTSPEEAEPPLELSVQAESVLPKEGCELLQTLA